MAVLTNAELVAAVAALEWVANRADLATVLNRFMQAEKKPPTVTKKMLAKAVNFLKSQNGEAAQTARIARGMKIKEWLRTGELEGTERDTKAGLDMHPGDAPYAEFYQRFLHYYSQDICVATTVFPGIEEVLSRLEERGAPWGIVTNKAQRFTSEANCSRENLPATTTGPQRVLRATCSATSRSR
jgi:phosphoglycolate phosphatase-like HAD superfamily hydrolase